MTVAKLGDTVKVHYTGKLDNGQIFDDSLDRQPLEFKVGGNQLIENFEKAVIGMNVGDWKTIKIPYAQAYGPHRKDLLVAAKLTQLPEGLKPVVGQQLQITQDEGSPIIVTVIEITQDKIILDANHPLAGKDLNFDIKLVGIV
jgi:peptidylprolyl isomerase